MWRPVKAADYETHSAFAAKEDSDDETFIAVSTRGMLVDKVELCVAVTLGLNLFLLVGLLVLFFLGLEGPFLRLLGY